MRLQEINEKGYTGYELTQSSREKLLSIFTPIFSKFIGHHITYKFNVTAENVPEQCSARIIGYAQEGGLEALVAEINGSTARPDGKIYHVTWSLTPEIKKPVDSNNLLQRGWKKVSPIEINVQPKFFSFK